MRCYAITLTSPYDETADIVDRSTPLDTQFENQLIAFPCGKNHPMQKQRNRIDPRAFVVVLFAMRYDVTRSDLEQYALRACSLWGVHDTILVDVEECSFRNAYNMADYFHSNFDTRYIFDQNGLNEYRNLVCSHTGTWCTVIERMIADKSLSTKEAVQDSERTIYNNSLTSEIKRIYNTTVEDGASTSSCPVHYIIEESDPTQCRSSIDLLVSALSQVGRIPSRRIHEFDIDDADHIYTQEGLADQFDTLFNASFATALCGTTFVIRYGLHDSQNAYSTGAHYAYRTLLDALRPYRDKIQLVFVIPTGRRHLVDKITRDLDMPVVFLKEDRAPSLCEGSLEAKLEVVKTRAVEQGYVPDAELESVLRTRVESGLNGDVDDVLREWQQRNDLLSHFPQYVPQLRSFEEVRSYKTKDEESPIERLESLIGLDKVKRTIHDILARAQMNKELEQQGLPVQDFSLHLAFLGEPGTGKTEVANLYGAILKEAGIIKEGRVITVSGSGSWSIEKAFDKAEGCVLFIDEAYAMIKNSNEIAELIALMEQRRNSTVVILAGYEGHMNRLLDSNPGFRSRLGFTLHFPNYTPEQLLAVFDLMCSRAQLELTPEAHNLVRDILERPGKRNDQGNARYARKLFEDTVGAQQVRLAKVKPDGGYTIEELCRIEAEDIPHDNADETDISAREQLQQLVGLEQVKQLISDRMDFARLRKLKRDRGLDVQNIPMHMVFSGNPGTGKTEVARLIAKILKEEGVLSVGNLYECSRQDLVLPGITAAKVGSLFQDARGSVIFIDEAYSLIDGCAGGSGDEAITAIIDQMEKLRDEVVVIFAGYKREMENLLSLNPGFESRIGLKVEFPDYSLDEMVDILDMMVEKADLIYSDEARKKARSIIDAAMDKPHYGNARYARLVLEKATIAQSARLAAGDCIEDLDNETLRTLETEDFQSEAPKVKQSLGFAC